MTEPPVPHQDSPFDPTRLLELRARADLVLRNAGDEPDRLKAAAAVLCAFYQALDTDAAFWSAVEEILGNQDVQRILQVPADFEDEEYDILLRAGVDPLTAAALAADLQSAIDRYEPGSVPQLQTVRDAVRRLGDAVCAAESAFDSPETPRQRRPKLKLLARALNVAGAIVSIGLNVSVALLVSTVAGLIVVAGGSPER